MAGKSEASLFNCIFSAMGALLLLVAAWIGSSASHIPTIEQKLEDFALTTNKTLGEHEVRINEITHTLSRHEIEIHDLAKVKK